MMRFNFAVFMSVIVLSSMTGALDGRVVVVTVAESPAVFAPVSLPYEGPAPAGRVEAVNLDTGDVAPVTYYEGRLVFVPPSMPANEEQRFQFAAREEAAPPRVRLEHDSAAGTVAVFVRDEHFTTYHYGQEARIPFLWPVYAEGGLTITRNFPMGEDSPVVSDDHRHHVSIWTAFGDVNRVDTWHRAPITTSEISVHSGDAMGVIRAHHVWSRASGVPVVDEIREYRFYDGPAGIRFMDQSTLFVAAHGEVRFGDNKEGLVAFRIRPEIQGNQAGLLTNAAGGQGEAEVYGTPMPWMDYSGPVADAGNRGIALFSHPDNFRQPCWHVRNYGLFAANPFALSDVGKLGTDGAHVLGEGEQLLLKYRFFVHTGDVEEAAVAQRYADYAEPPRVAWQE